MSYHIPLDQFRVQDARLPEFQSAENFPTEGAFLLPPRIGNRRLFVIASCDLGWEHVSVSIREGVRTPVWAEMAYVKAIFWDAEDCVIQYHPPESEYVNMHPNVLHLWRPVGVQVLRPHPLLVGLKGVTFAAA